MGHTLVTRFEDAFYERMNAMLGGTSANKIPFGRDCDRRVANERLDYHMTVFHWKSEEDEHYLPLADRIRFLPFSIKITGTKLTYAEEGSLLLYFCVRAGENCPEAMGQVREALNARLSGFPHITLAVSRDHASVEKLKELVDGACRYPFKVKVVGLDLYHIWRPVRLKKQIRD